MPPVVLSTLQSLKELEGKEIATTEWLPMTQERIRQFADATEDHQWIHLDPERAHRESPYAGTIAHGFLTLSLIAYFLRQAIQIPAEIRWTVNYGLNRVRFPSPVRVNTQIRARVSLASMKELPDCVEVIFGVIVEAEGSEKPCCVAEWVVRYYR